MGDPVGIGSEVILKALSARSYDAEIVVYGDLKLLQAAADLCGRGLDLLGPDRIRELSQLGLIRPGSPTEATDRAQIEYIERAVADVQAGRMDALVTAPISKAAIARAGSPFPGHTEMLAALTAAPGAAPRHPVMMLAGPSLKVVPLTVHVRLSDVPGRISPELLLETLRVVHEAGRRDFGWPTPRIAVAGLNPHAGEGGMFGDEEPRLLLPGIERAQAEGILAVGPLPADTVFGRAARGEFDVVVGMYHDQALIPVKLLDFDRAVNVTLGLSIIRTSVDHGTAYDIAGRGVASSTSMESAIDLAAQMVRARRSARP
jgi:4-hydroxythreonine-4-phosphate dehydrogenase